MKTTEVAAMKSDHQSSHVPQRPLWTYGAALIAAVSGVGLRLLLDPLLGDQVPFLFPFLTVLLVARHVGRGPALFTLCVSAFAVTWFVIEPRRLFYLGSLEQRLGLIFYIAVGWIAIGLIHAIDRLRRAAEFDRIRLHQEISGRQAAEQELIRRQQLLQTTLESLGDAVITTNAAGEVASLNAVAEQLTGWTSAEARGHPLGVVFRVANEHDRCAFSVPIESVLRDGAVVPLPGSSLLRSLRGDDCCIDGTAAPIRAGTGVALGCVLLFRDVTDRRRSQHLRNDAEDRIRSVIDHVVDGIITIDEQGVIESFNPAAERVFGYLATEVLGQNVKLLMPEPYRSEHDDYIAHYLHTGEARVIGIGREVTGRRKDGSTFPMDLAVSKFTHRGRQYFTGIVRDISERKRSEAALFASEERLRGFMDHNPAMAWLKDDAGRYVLGSASFVAPFGVTQQDIIGRTDHDLFSPHIAEDYRRNDLQVLASGQPGEFMELTEEPDGVHSHLVVKFPVRDAHGRQYIGGVAIDITQQKVAEARVEAEARRAQLVADAVPALISYIGSDACYQLNNRAYEVWFGHSRSEIAGRHMRDVLGESAWEALRPFVETALRGEFVAYEAEIPYRDGGTRWISASYTPDVDDDGRVRGFVAHVMDISHRKRTEQALHDSERRFRNLAETVPSIVWTADPQGTITYVNSRWLEYCGISAEDNASRWPELVLHPDDRERCVAAWNAALRDGTEYQVEVRNRRHDGVYRWFVTKALPQTDDQGRVTAWFGVTTDIHDQKELQDQLREADRRKDEFLATLAHELRNPLAPIRAALELLRADSDQRQFQEAHAVMDRQVVHMVRLIDDLLDVSRINRNKLKLRKNRIELAAIVQQAVATARPVCDQNGHQLEVAISPEPMTVHADPVRLAQILGNLLTNACKYTPAGGRIWVTVASQDGAALITVKDTGIGIPSEMLPRVFDLFTQVDRSLERSDGGLGIGLSLVKRLVELHGGTVEAHSAGPGCGAEFTVRLPITRDAPVRQSAPPAAPASAVTPQRILIVDDNQDAARTLGMLLKATGHMTLVVHDGAEALQAAANFGPDLILLDLGLPTLNGYEVCRTIRAEPWGAAISIVALTGWGQDSDRRKSTAAGFNAHLVKPVDYSTLSRLIAELADRRRDPPRFEAATLHAESTPTPVPGKA